MSRNERRSTIVDVGRQAGVSTKTVSRVFNNEPNVRLEVRERVRAAAKLLHYHPNVLAQALVSRRSHLIGLVYENPSPSYVVELQRGVLDRLKDERFRLVVIPISSVAEREQEVVGLLRSAALDGVVLAPPASDSETILDDLAAAGMACARIAPTQMLDRGASNMMDDVAAARCMAAHLLGLGHRRIAVIMGDPSHASTRERTLGYEQAFAEAGLNASEVSFEPGLFTRESGYEAARRILSDDPSVTAIAAENDDMAIGALLAARELGLEVPSDLSIAGFDDSEVSKISWPAITTIRQPVFEMAAAAADMLVEQLQTGTTAPLRHHDFELVVRGSTGPVPK